jgi:rhodanese-related sulfurtransferase
MKFRLRLYREILDWTPVSALNTLIRWRFPTVEHISVDDFVQRHLAAENLLLLDARAPADAAFGFGDVPLSAMPYEQLKHKVSVFRLQHPHGLVVVLCVVGYRSSCVARQLSRSGFRGIVNLQGGLRAVQRQWPAAIADILTQSSK